MAEREGVEPSMPLLAAYTISSRAPSASSDISPQFMRHNDTFYGLYFVFKLFSHKLFHDVPNTSLKLTRIPSLSTFGSCFRLLR